MAMDDAEIVTKIEELKIRHRDLDDAIKALIQVGSMDMIQVQRLKKQKLRLKDRINMLEDDLLPDIIA